jgi:hypothetical protein
MRSFQYALEECEACILRREAGEQDGEVLEINPLGWRAAPGFVLDSAPVPLPAACGRPASARWS